MTIKERLDNWETVPVICRWIPVWLRKDNNAFHPDLQYYIVHNSPKHPWILIKDTCKKNDEALVWYKYMSYVHTTSSNKLIKDFKCNPKLEFLKNILIYN